MLEKLDHVKDPAVSTYATRSLLKAVNAAICKRYVNLSSNGVNYMQMQ